MKGDGGFTVVEVLVALSLLALGMLLFLQTATLTMGLHARVRRGVEALLLAQESTELLLAWGWEEAVLSLASEAGITGEIDAPGPFAVEAERGGGRYGIVLERRGDHRPFRHYRVTCLWRGSRESGRQQRSVRISSAGGGGR